MIVESHQDKTKTSAFKGVGNWLVPQGKQTIIENWIWKRVLEKLVINKINTRQNVQVWMGSCLVYIDILSQKDAVVVQN